jgi:hypothetical protein
MNKFNYPDSAKEGREYKCGEILLNSKTVEYGGRLKHYNNVKFGFYSHNYKCGYQLVSDSMRVKSDVLYNFLKDWDSETLVRDEFNKMTASEIRKKYQGKQVHIYHKNFKILKISEPSEDSKVFDFPNFRIREDLRFHDDKSKGIKCIKPESDPIQPTIEESVEIDLDLLGDVQDQSKPTYTDKVTPEPLESIVEPPSPILEEPSKTPTNGLYVVESDSEIDYANLPTEILPGMSRDERFQIIANRSFIANHKKVGV